MKKTKAKTEAVEVADGAGPTVAEPKPSIGRIVRYRLTEGTAAHGTAEGTWDWPERV